MNYNILTNEIVEGYLKEHADEKEITCLLKHDDISGEDILRRHGFRYVGKRLADGNIRSIFRWFNGMTDPYEDMAAFFDRRAEDYDLHMRAGNEDYEKGLDWVTSFIEATDKKVTILDLGCGTGAELEYIFRRVPHAQVLCIDLSMGMLEKLKQNYSGYIDNIEIICGSYLGLDFGAECYDYVIACNTLHHILKEDKTGLYKNIRKSLKNDGLLLIEDYVVTEEEEKELRAGYLALLEDGKINGNKLYHIDLTLSESSERAALETSGFSKLFIERAGGNGINIIAEK
jgi:tRNA (cmo5U34)-methyltransferase